MQGNSPPAAQGLVEWNEETPTPLPLVLSPSKDPVRIFARSLSSSAEEDEGGSPGGVEGWDTPIQQSSDFFSRQAALRHFRDMQGGSHGPRGANQEVARGSLPSLDPAVPGEGDGDVG